MLVLSRAENETIRIGDDIRITMLGFARGGKVRLGIEAPPDVPIIREELPAQAIAGIASRANRQGGITRRVNAAVRERETAASTSASAENRCSEQSAAPVASGEQGAAEAHNLGAAGSIPAAAS